MKRYLIPILVAVLVLTSGLLSGCVQEGIIPSKVDTPPQPDVRLLEFQQMKLTQLEELNTELTDLQVNIDEKEAEVHRLNTLIDKAYERLGLTPGSPVGLHRLTSEEIIAMLKVSGVNKQLSNLQKEQRRLLAIKQYLEQDIEEIQQHAKLEKYYELKLSQLDDLTTQLVVLRIDIDQKIAWCSARV